MLLTLEQTIDRIHQGRVLHIAADDALLSQLPKGNWIGGTTPYFITEEGGILCKDKLYVDELNFAKDYKAKVYAPEEVLSFTDDAYSNEICFLILPYASEVAAVYAKEAPLSASLFMTPTLGWVSGYDLSTEGQAKVYDGFSGTAYTDQALALHIQLPETKIASLGIINIFQPSTQSPEITFQSDSMSIRTCKIDGTEVLLAEYLAQHNINTQLPLISNHNGILLNVSIKVISKDNTVELYAPVFEGYTYRFAYPVSDYVASFSEQLQTCQTVEPIFSCNCILNYLYGNLEGKATMPFTGPVTFGEIAYQLLNQTLVYAQILDI